MNATSNITADTTSRDASNSVQEAVQQHSERERELAEKAPAAAAQIIASIPECVGKATATHLRENHPGTRVRGSLMEINYDGTNERLPTTFDQRGLHFFDTKKLKHAARLVFDHCAEAGLNPYLAVEIVDGVPRVSMFISWSLPGGDEARPTKRWRWQFLGFGAAA
ncbi:MAG TPA: hypothetical protein V6C86_18120 [Oculatellaceae cyanobacterium]